MPLFNWLACKASNRRRSRNLSWTAEGLEVRVVPASLEVTSVRGGVLRVKADSDAAVHVSFIASEDGMRVVGDNGTTINGLSEVFFEKARTIRGKLGAGNDVVSLTESNSVDGVCVSLNLGEGANQFTAHLIPLDELSLTSGGGTDAFHISNVGARSLTMKMGAGNDFVTFLNSSVEGSTNLSAKEEVLFAVIGSRFGSRPRLQNVTLV